MEDRAKKRRVKRIIDSIVWCSAWAIVIIALIIIIGNQNAMYEKISVLSNKTNAEEQYVKDVNKMLKNEGQAVIEPNQVNEYTDTFTITYYCPCEKCCGKSDGITATGTKATEGRTVGVDSNVIPLGSELIIDGQAYIAEDTGNIKGKTIDVFVNSHERALELGRTTKQVVIKGI